MMMLASNDVVENKELDVSIRDLAHGVVPVKQFQLFLRISSSWCWVIVLIADPSRDTHGQWRHGWGGGGRASQLLALPRGCTKIRIKYNFPAIGNA
jgi:hypothetical protein